MSFFLFYNYIRVVKVRKNIIEFLDYLGFSPKYLGYNYIVDVSVLTNKLFNKNKKIKIVELYNNVAEKYNTNFKCVDKNTRVCLEGTFKNGNINHINQIFENISAYYDDRPSNKLFFMTIINYLNKNK